MRKVRRDELLDFVTYGEQREKIRADVLAQKRVRRFHLGEVLTFLFENPATVRYQVLEMIRVERIVKESDIQHELDTYNKLLPRAGQLGCTLLVELEEPAERDDKLRRWHALPETLYLRLPDGGQAFAEFDPAQRGEERVSSVQYLTFPVEGQVPLAVGCELPDLQGEVELSEEQRAALKEDLAAE